jgi:heme A synthase
VALVCRRDASLRRITALALLLGCTQVTAGIVNVLLAIPVEVTAIHSALAAGLVLTLTAAVRAAWTERA